jgi:hypothetical protein
MGVLIKEDIAMLVALLLFSSALWAVRSTSAASLGEGFIEPQWEWYKEAYEWKWTLLIQAHSPKYGNTEGTSTWSYESIYVVGALGSTSSLSHGATLLPSDGSCAARFQLAYWKYERWDNPRLGTTREYWRIVQTQNWFIVCDIHDGSVTSCSDDLESITYSGYNSISYTARYKSQDRIEDNPSSSWYYVTVSAGSGSLIEADLRITVSVQGGGISTGVFKLKNTNSNTWVYKYKFGPQHSWSIDYLDSNGLIWAFSLRW